LSGILKLFLFIHAHAYKKLSLLVRVGRSAQVVILEKRSDGEVLPRFRNIILVLDLEK
jgi:hypothetical protein